MKKVIQGTMDITAFEDILVKSEHFNLKVEFSRLSLKMKGNKVRFYAAYAQDRMPPLHFLEGVKFDGIFMNPPLMDTA